MKINQPPKFIDVAILSLFAVLITFNPNFMHRDINFFEVGLYLPGIQSILNGEIPYRDFFHLRGPVELYVPAFLMNIFGMHLTVLYAYFYVGSVLCLIFGIFIAREILKSRFMLYCLVPVFIARTYPRVVYTYWGGLRYALGLLTLWFVVRYFKKEQKAWMFWAGISTALGLLTSIEVGICSLLGILGSLLVSRIFAVQKTQEIYKAFSLFIFGFVAITVPYFFYLHAQGALLPFFDTMITVVTKMEKTLNPRLVSVYPQNLAEAIPAMLIPGHINFKQMTPSYAYIAVAAYLIYRIRKRTFLKSDLAVVAVGIYGFVLYNTGFRSLWAAQFEMALQPEKILYFFILEAILLWVVMKEPAIQKFSEMKYLVNVLLIFFFAFSWSYALKRFNHRFFAFQFLTYKLTGKNTNALSPWANRQTKVLDIERARGLVVSKTDAEELEQIDAFVKVNIPKGDLLFTYPEIPAYNFFFNRRFVGRFPWATASWFKDEWHQEYIDALKKARPKHLILGKVTKSDWQQVYLGPPLNRQKYNEVMDYINSHYIKVQETPYSYLYQRLD